MDTVHHRGLHLVLGAFQSSLVESLYTESGLPSFCQRCDLFSLWSCASLHQFLLSKYQSIPPYLSPSLCLPNLFSVGMNGLLSHSPSPHLRSLPFSVYSFPPWLVPSSCICFSVFPDPPKSGIFPPILPTHFLNHFSTRQTFLCYVMLWSTLVLLMQCISFSPTHSVNMSPEACTSVFHHLFSFTQSPSLLNILMVSPSFPFDNLFFSLRCLDTLH